MQDTGVQNSSMDDTVIIDGLITSFTKQLEWYGELKALVASCLSRIVLSRGDVSQIMGSLARKRELADAIAGERERIKPVIDAWQKIKAGVPADSRTVRLNELLERTQTVIRDYLHSEQQMNKYLGHLAGKEEGR